MDLYLFYNCINNLMEIYDTPEHSLTLRHQYLFNNPLLLSEYFDKTKYKPILYNLEGGFVGLALKVGAKVGPGLAKAALKGGPKAASKGGPSSASKAVPGPKDIMAKFGSKMPTPAKFGSKMLSSPTSAPAADTGNKSVSKTGEFNKIIKKFIRLIMIIVFIICIPFAPWIFISFYAFKNLGKFIEVNMNRL